MKEREEALSKTENDKQQKLLEKQIALAEVRRTAWVRTNVLSDDGEGEWHAGGGCFCRRRAGWRDGSPEGALLEVWLR